MAVYKGDSRYGAAPFEESIVEMRDIYTIQMDRVPDDPRDWP
jgi:hypothetical protein